MVNRLLNIQSRGADAADALAIAIAALNQGAGWRSVRLAGIRLAEIRRAAINLAGVGCCD